jgi:hypothetical protein
MKDMKASEIITFQSLNFVLFASFVVKCLSILVRRSRAPLKKNMSLDLFRSVQIESVACVIPAWSAGIQADTDVSGRIL